MSSSLPDPKRRRLNNTSALSKPFKSPLKQDNALANSNTFPSPTTYRHASKTPSKLSSSTAACDASTPSAVTTQRSALSSQPATSALSRRARTLRSEIDTLEQATRLLTPDAKTQKLEDDRIRSLITKWRSIAQAAAEEVHSATSEQVVRMGGMKAWREQERQRLARDAEWRRGGEMAESGEKIRRAEDDDEGGDAINGVGTAERREIEAMRKQARDIAEVGGVRRRPDGGGGGEEEIKAALEEDQEEGFTMGRMLKTLGIDFETVGWDRVNERWAE